MTGTIRITIAIMITVSDGMEEASLPPDSFSYWWLVGNLVSYGLNSLKGYIRDYTGEYYRVF